MIRLVTGPLGTGKSYYGVRKAVEAIETGRMVVTNFAMEPDWIERVVMHHRILGQHRSGLRDRVERFEGRYKRVHTLDELMQVRVRPVAPFATANRTGKMVVKEGSCVVLLDEAHRWMNARSWSQKGREGILEWFALARKRGFEVYLIAQRAENLDVQVRELFEDRIGLANLRRSARLLGLPVIPFNFFIASWRNHAGGDEVVKWERYRLRWIKSLYDTMDTASFGEGDTFSEGQHLWLPLGSETEPDTDGLPDGGGARSAMPPASPPALAPPASGGAEVVAGVDPSLKR
ncbi:MAG TPA: zonular occludens toxin domain-containing protein [Solirubrobacterales bacterium]|nr:zonular occludens toxin domain-containing protein [Solirubrobacterales bacterium]